MFACLYSAWCSSQRVRLCVMSPKPIHTMSGCVTPLWISAANPISNPCARRLLCRREECVIPNTLLNFLTQFGSIFHHTETKTLPPWGLTAMQAIGAYIGSGQEHYSSSLSSHSSSSLSYSSSLSWHSSSSLSSHSSSSLSYLSSCPV